jgi:hypothetical protein
MVGSDFDGNVFVRICGYSLHDSRRKFRSTSTPKALSHVSEPGKKPNVRHKSNG